MLVLKRISGELSVLVVVGNAVTKPVAVKPKMRTAVFMIIAIILYKGRSLAELYDC